MLRVGQILKQKCNVGSSINNVQIETPVLKPIRNRITETVQGRPVLSRRAQRVFSEGGGRNDPPVWEKGTGQI